MTVLLMYIGHFGWQTGRCALLYEYLAFRKTLWFGDHKEGDKQCSSQKAVEDVLEMTEVHTGQQGYVGKGKGGRMKEGREERRREEREEGKKKCHPFQCLVLLLLK